MRIAFTHNLQLTDSEEEAEFDTPATVAAISQALRALGHDVEPVEVSGPASRVVARLEALSPDLVFNTAEGTRGRFREAFYPALFDRLGLPYTGSDAYVCALTLDKNLTKLALSKHDIPSPRGTVVTNASKLDVEGWRFPIIAKPNYEGSSMGITTQSVVDDATSLKMRIVELLARFPTGVLVEEFIVGQDVVVPFLEKASPATGGVLEPASYGFDPQVVGDRKYQLYDYELKTAFSSAVTVHVPAAISPAARTRVMALSQVIFRELGIRDMGRIDFRVADDGTVYFIEVNALPSLEPGASIYESAARMGLGSMEAVLGQVVQSAADRHGLHIRARSRVRRTRLRVGLAYNLKPPHVPGASDERAEFDTPETVAAIHQVIESYGHDVVDLEATPELATILQSSSVDLVFNIAEGMEGRARESQIPALLELLGIPYTGSDPTALSLALDKALAKRLVAQAGFRTAPFTVMASSKEKLPKDLRFPVIAKPLHEGSSKGVVENSVVETEAELRGLVKRLIETYRQSVLVESFLPGREFTVALLGERRPRVLPPMEILFQPDERFPIYTFSRKFEGRPIAFEVPAKVDSVIRKDLERSARAVFTVLGCRDVARIDFRLDHEGRVAFIECNPLPGLSPGFSDLCVIAEAAGIDYRTLIGEILAPAIRRHKERRRKRLLGGDLRPMGLS